MNTQKPKWMTDAEYAKAKADAAKDGFDLDADLAKVMAIPDDVFMAELNLVRRQELINRVAKEFQVPRPLAEFRLKQLGHIDGGRK